MCVLYVYECVCVCVCVWCVCVCVHQEAGPQLGDREKGETP